MKMTIEDAKRAVLAVAGDFGALERALDDLVQVATEFQRAKDAALIRRGTETGWDRVSDTYGYDYSRGWRFGRERAAEVVEKGELS
ncbi:hypothetical protein SEA_VIEENROSE_62 [Streptomyces phage VieEnRose]|nr:hypothetical protein SEA_VIEENROSE_62 [Streptomyces phage VieEnRose]